MAQAAAKLPPAPPSPGDDGPLDPLVAPTAARWRRMSTEERWEFLEDSLAALAVPAEAMTEGAPHAKAKVRIWTLLQEHFRRVGRAVYLGSELPVHYPGERIFSPDLIAVCDVPDPGEADRRMAWVVTAEKKGVDLALEVLHHGDAEKDLVTNVSRFARLGIREYFVYDRLHDCLIGYHLRQPRVRRYSPIPATDGLMRSEVLGLDLGLIEGRLVFQHGGVEVEGSALLLERANSLVADLQDRLDAADRQLAVERAAREALERRIAELMSRRPSDEPEG